MLGFGIGIWGYDFLDLGCDMHGSENWKYMDFMIMNDVLYLRALRFIFT